jgi:Coenzyme PQQ synthesis protein D (PqqD)
MTEKLSLTSSVRINDAVLFQELQGEAVLLNLNTGVYFGLEEIGTRVWQLIGEKQVLSRVLETMLQEYDVAEEKCAQALLELVAEMQEQGLVSIG